jgi:hypothetical protein
MTMNGPPIGPDELPANLVRKCARCNDFTAEMTEVVTTTQHQVNAAGMQVGPNQMIGRDYRFKCAKCGDEFRVPGGQSMLTFGGIAIGGLVVIVGGLSQGVWAMVPIGLLFALPVAWGFYQRRKHPGMF